MASLFYIFPALAIVSLPLTLTTVYALLVVTAMHREMSLPKWLFPEDRKAGQVSAATKRQLPSSVQLARILLYAWWGIVVTSVASTFRPAPLELGLPFWIAQIALLAALLWIVGEVSNGKHWARIVLVCLFALSVRSLIVLLVRSPRYGVDFAVVVMAFALLTGAVALVFSRSSAAYFRQTQN
jgi:hypothetical protein